MARSAAPILVQPILCGCFEALRVAANDSAPIKPLILLDSTRGQCVWGWRPEQLIVKCPILTNGLKLKHYNKYLISACVQGTYLISACVQERLHVYKGFGFL